MELYDESGQVYTERVAAEVRSMVPAWSRQTRGDQVNPSRYKERWKGAASLRDMAMRSCMWRIHDMDPTALQWLGWHYARQIYNQLQKTDTLSFNAWSIFRRAFPEHIDRHHAFRYYEKDGPVQLPSIVDRFSRLDGSVLSFLCLQNLDLNVDHLFSLLKISSLAVLVIDPCLRGSSESIASKNISNWGRAVRETGAFQKLGVLVLVSMPSNSAVTMDGTLSFPSLVLLGTQAQGHRAGKNVSQSPDRPWLAITDDSSWHPNPNSLPTQTPHQIWTDPKTTRESQMQSLYNLSTQLATNQSPAPPAPPATHARISMSYGHTARQAQISWFCRTRLKQQTPGLTHKRSSDVLALQHKTREPDKKRRIRAARKVDVGTFLGGLM